MLFNLPTEAGSCSQCEYVEKWKQGMQEADSIARENAQKSAQRTRGYMIVRSEALCCTQVTLS